MSTTYESMTVTQLRQILKERDLPTNGKKNTLVGRLSSSDEQDCSACRNCGRLEKRLASLEDQLRELRKLLVPAGRGKVSKEAVPAPAAKVTAPTTPKAKVARKKRVVILADSHGRNVSKLVQERLGDDYSVTAIFKPGAPMREVLRGAETFSADADAVVVLGGTNDISSAGRLDLAAFLPVLRRLKRKVIVSRLPRRFDSRPEDEATMEANRLLDNHRRDFKVRDFFSNLNRSNYTKHGLHLNVSGKRILAANIANEVMSCF